MKWKLRYGALQPNIYVITLAKGSDQLEIYHSIFLRQKYYRKHPPYIIGICKGYEEALDTVIGIVQAAIEKSGSPDIKKFLFSQVNH
ncbi:hypothetical protein [Kineothrix sp. MB12-C1]|uniref:hypothetical protein n=1 Tax=Kineothrix sp. MB12-C1 TaxID=3070215 RepID=UPI0027D26B93|nr:hypothetical protein [Kineothrix sp. MB12-C1]WMC92847.1 hypothetical protein RBB56_00740 [Kineothrix sp. MB12-C1]